MPDKPNVDRRGFFKTAGAAAAGFALAEVLTGGEARAAGLSARDFIRTVKNARLFDLSHTWDENSPPLKIRGGTGSALRSFALVP